MEAHTLTECLAEWMSRLGPLVNSPYASRRAKSVLFEDRRSGSAKFYMTMRSLALLDSFLAEISLGPSNFKAGLTGGIRRISSEGIDLEAHKSLPHRFKLNHSVSFRPLFSGYLPSMTRKYVEIRKGVFFPISKILSHIDAGTDKPGWTDGITQEVTNA